MKRVCESLLKHHLAENRQMIFVAGPRQVGKTTTCRLFRSRTVYFNWDNEDHRLLILKGPGNVADQIGITQSKTIIFDELYKYPNWKNFIKGFFDTYSTKPVNIIVTGSARFDVYRQGADSLMGRYFIYRMHPLSVGEIVKTEYPEKEIKSPKKIKNKDYDSLLDYSGFPEPYLKRNERFYNKWRRIRNRLLLQQDIRDVTNIQEIRQVEILSEFLRQQAGQLSNYAALANKIRVSENSIRRWISTLELLYYCFAIRPWKENIARSLLKEPKIYLWDWAAVTDPGAKFENFIACHLLKAVHWWQDNGFGEYGLYYLRTKDKREVDFLVSKNEQAWFIVEAKLSGKRDINKNLA
ncbi:MAG: AAA family ATPase, partial [bacterium]